jgi:hypothetical protein
MLQSVLGISIDALDQQIVLAHPVVPDGLDEIRGKNLPCRTRPWTSP